MELAITILQVLLAVVLIVFVLGQSGKNSGMGVISGGSNDTFLSKNKANTADAKLAKYTKWIAFAYMVLTLVLCLL
ncbi:MAG: preprotein translocase subunit SecG [Evtepia sp.]